MSLCFEHEHSTSPVLDQPGFLFPVEGRPDLLPAQPGECKGDALHSEAYFFDPAAAPTTSDESANSVESGESGASGELSEAGGSGESSTPSGETVVTSGTSVDRLYAYLSRDFNKFDSNQDKKLDAKELEASLAATTNSDELMLLSWMSKNMDALQKLGDRDSGISMEDLAGLNTAINKGTGDLGLAFRHTDWVARGGSSVVGGLGGAFLGAKLTSTAFSIKSAAGFGAAVFGTLSAIDAIGYYMFDKPKLDQALKELNAIPVPNANRS